MNRAERTMQRCAVCKNATGGCSWSRDFTPVYGWIAQPKVVRHRLKQKQILNVKTYKIISCPEFIYDGMCHRCKKCPRSEKLNEDYAERCKYFRLINGNECINFEYGA